MYSTKMGYVIQDCLIKNNLIDAKPQGLTPVLIAKGYFNDDHRNGLPLRNVLRELDIKNLLHLLPQVRVDRKVENRYWFFNAVEN